MVEERLRSLRQSFACAFRGIGRAIRQERNFRIHLAAAVILLWLAAHLSLSRGEWALLLLAVGLMLSAEMFNTALEWLCDRADPGWNSLSQTVKDLSAGAVLVCALFCVGVGIALLWQPSQLAAIAREIIRDPRRTVFAALAAVGGVAFVFVGPGQAARFFRQEAGKRKERNR